MSGTIPAKKWLDQVSSAIALVNYTPACHQLSGFYMNPTDPTDFNAIGHAVAEFTSEEAALSARVVCRRIRWGISRAVRESEY